MKPQRIQLSRRKGFDLQKVSLVLNGLPAVNCARPGKWGNPFIVGKDGTRAKCVELFRNLCAGLLCISRGRECADRQRAFLEYATDQRHLKSLRGKNLACWCALDGKPCHADVLLKIANP